jgi:rod shape-determining protein MreC
MYNKKKMPIRYIVLIILVLVVIFLAIVFKVVNEDRKLSPIEQTIKDTGLFFNKVIYAPINFVNKKINETKEKNNLHEKYKKLQKRIDEIDLLQAKYDEVERELKSMLKTLELNKTLSKNTYLNATVINRNIGYWYNTITIDKGEKHGVKVDMPVIVSEGLIGKIISTTNFSSTVKLLTNEDRSNKISIKIKVDDQFVYGLLTGYNHKNNTFIIEGIDENIDIPIGSFVTTTGLGNLFPSGIMVGKVKSAKTDNFDLAKIIEIKSDVDFNDLSVVTILKREDTGS